MTMKLQNSHYELENLTEIISDSIAVSVLNSERKIIFANEIFCIATGYSESELVGQNADILNAESTNLELDTRIEKTLESGKTWSGQIYHRKKNGQSFCLATTIYPILDKHGKVERQVHTHYDITEWLKTEQNASKARDEVVRDSHTQAFLYAQLCQDLKTPLGAIMEIAKELESNFDPIEVSKKSKGLIACANEISRQLAPMLLVSKNNNTNTMPLQKAAHRPSIQKENCNILLVDDVEDHLIALGVYLKKLGIKYQTATSGKLALDLVKEQNFDLILMDVQMPDMTGLEATKLIRKLENMTQREHTYIVALTAQTTEQERQESFSAGCDYHFCKPLTKVQLFEFLSSLNILPSANFNAA